MIPKLYLMLAKVIGLFAAGLVLGLAINAWRYGADISDLKAAQAAELKKISDTAQAATSEALAGQQAAQQALAALDHKYTQEMNSAQLQIESLRDDVASGKRRLRIHAKCPASGNDVPQTTTATGVDDGAAPELTRTAERDYLRLRERIDTITHQVTALQDYVRAACLK